MRWVHSSPEGVHLGASAPLCALFSSHGKNRLYLQSPEISRADRMADLKLGSADPRRLSQIAGYPKNLSVLCKLHERNSSRLTFLPSEFLIHFILDISNKAFNNWTKLKNEMQVHEQLWTHKMGPCSKKLETTCRDFLRHITI